MTREELRLSFEAACDTERHQFRRVTDPGTRRPDLCAFLLLDRLVPGAASIVSWAEHDIITLGVDVDALAAAATPDDIITLARCGVFYSADHNALRRFT